MEGDYLSMQAEELLELIDQGEDSKTQFKLNITNAVQLAQEMVAFSNCKGGFIIVGVDDNANLVGLSREDINRLNQIISNGATENVKPSITPTTEIIKVNDLKVLVIEIKEGVNKPYCTNEGVYFTKVGSDKRKISQEELQRLFQEANKIYADETIVYDSTINDLDRNLFNGFYEKLTGEKIEDIELPLDILLENLNLAGKQHLTLAGLLLFGKKPQKNRPMFIVKAVNFLGNDLTGTVYRDSEDIAGNLPELFKDGMGFLLRSLRKIQVTETFNSLGELEVPRLVLEELFVNALIHRDYFINAPINLFVFDNRIEIISPGKLPNSLTVENIKSGLSIIRNPILTSFASKILPYRGVGTGIVRALNSYKNIDFENNLGTERFKVTIYRIPG